jgi:hypothetical protein
VSIKPKIVIASIARDISKTFEADYRRITASFSDFEIINWIIIESNSTDDSKEVLRKFSQSSNIIIYKSLMKSNDKSLFRTQELAIARNTYLSELNDIRQKIEIEWQRELALLEEDKAMSFAEFKNAEARLNEIDVKLEAYRLEDHNLKLDRWSLDPALYQKK